jgi:hypothetical protein
LLLLASPDADATLVSQVAQIAGEYAAQNSMAFEQRAGLDVATMPANLAKLVYFPTVGFDPAIVPANVSMVAVGECSAPAANIIPLCLSGGADAQAAFIAGYVAALTADDWRMGMIYSGAYSVLADDFIAGAEYYCGACVPLSPPLNEFPAAVQGEAAGWQAAADQLLSTFVRVVYLTPDLENSGAAEYLAGFGVLIIGSGTPAASLTANWLASVSSDEGAFLSSALPQALAGQSPTNASSLGLSNVNTAYISEARLANIQAVIADLLSGYIVLP